MAAENPGFQLEEGGGEPTGNGVLANGRASRKSADRSFSESKLYPQLMYSIEDVPPWYTCVLLGLQHYLTMVGGTITLPYILLPHFCVTDDTIRGYFISTIIFVSGIVTLLQTTFGVRLPIVQGSSFAFLAPAQVLLSASFEKCSSYNASAMTTGEQEELWHTRVRAVQGAIIVASLFQLLIGLTGLVGLLLRWITPLTVVPTVTLVGLSLFQEAAGKAAENWLVAIMTIVLLVAFSQYLQNMPVLVPSYKRNRGLALTSKYFFRICPVLLAMCLAWIICFILTTTKVLSEDSPASTSKTRPFLEKAPWLRVPYPFQWGVPSVSVAGTMGMLAAIFASIIESIGDYYVCAKLSGAGHPPEHAINRGIAVEGLGCLLAGIWGTGSGTTSYSENIGAIGITKVGSRRVVQAGALLMLACGVVGKFGGLFATIPNPIIGGVFCVMFAMITAVGLSTLQFVDLNSTRNLFIVGFSIFMGLLVPSWLKENNSAISTGTKSLDQVLSVLLQTGMCVAGFLGCFLDNTIPGTPEERGLLKWGILSSDSSGADPPQVHDFSYDLPFGMDYIKGKRWLRSIPTSPTFQGWLIEHKVRKTLKKFRLWLPWKREASGRSQE